MAVQYVAPLQRGWERMRRILFEPFRPVTWLALGFTAWLANLAGGMGGGGQFGVPSDDDSRRVLDGLHSAWARLAEVALFVPLLILAALVVVVLVLAVMWLSSRGKLMFLDNVVRGQALVDAPWRRCGRLGTSLFLWRLGFGAACLAAVGAILLMVLGPAVAAGSWRDPFAGMSIAAGIFGAVLVALIGLVAALVSLLLDSFVVPIMARYDLGAVAAWRALLPWLQAYPGAFVLYVLFVLVLALVMAAATVLVCVLTCFACCLWCIPLVGSYLMTVVLLPLWVTYRAFSVEWLAQLDPKFDLFAAVAAREAGGVPATPAAG